MGAWREWLVATKPLGKPSPSKHQAVNRAVLFKSIRGMQSEAGEAIDQPSGRAFASSQSHNFQARNLASVQFSIFVIRNCAIPNFAIRSCTNSNCAIRNRAMSNFATRHCKIFNFAIVQFAISQFAIVQSPISQFAIAQFPIAQLHTSNSQLHNFQFHNSQLHTFQLCNSQSHNFPFRISQLRNFQFRNLCNCAISEFANRNCALPGSQFANCAASQGHPFRNCAKHPNLDRGAYKLTILNEDGQPCTRVRKTRVFCENARFLASRARAEPCDL